MMNMAAGVAEPGEGERAEQARSRKFWTILIMIGAAGGLVGGIHAIVTGGDYNRSVPAFWAVVMALGYVGAVGIGSWYFFRSVDEVEMRANLWAGTVALYFYAMLYPVWYILWRGGLVLEPIHETLFMATWLVTAGAYFWKKLRP